MKAPKLKYIYKIGQRVILKHAGCYFSGIVSKHTFYKAPQANAKPKATYTVKGDNGFIYPLLGVDGTMGAGNILSEDTKAGRIIERAADNEEEIYERPVDDKYKIQNLSVLREIAKKRNVPYYGSKSQLIERLIAHDKLNIKK